MKRVITVIAQLSWRTYVASLFWSATALVLSGQTVTTLHSFDGTDGAGPGGFVQATNGDLYGTTVYYGVNSAGTIFRITPKGALTLLYSFCLQGGACTDGEGPYGLTQATNGYFYGVTVGGGLNNNGTVFKMTPGGVLTTLHRFCSQGGGCADGAKPFAGVVQAANGNFYGTTVDGGTYGGGTIFQITSGGALTTLYNFCPQGGLCADGQAPETTLIQATNGELYGATATGGANASSTVIGGTIFRITTSGTFTTIYSFCSQSGCTDGQNPNSLIQATDGYFYGTTLSGGTNNDGTVFKITPSGTLTTLFSFSGAPPNAVGLVQATNGKFYGTTYSGGTNGGGTVFQITPSGTLTTLYNFCAQSGCTDGQSPNSLIQVTNGEFYGTTFGGGANDTCAGGCGTLFSLSLGLGPFVKTQPVSGKVGAVVNILGYDLTGATSVSFSGTAATFRVVSSSEITTTVPAGASSGRVQVVTPSRTLSSNVPFQVLP